VLDEQSQPNRDLVDAVGHSCVASDLVDLSGLPEVVEVHIGIGETGLWWERDSAMRRWDWLATRGRCQAHHLWRGNALGIENQLGEELGLFVAREMLSGLDTCCRCGLHRDRRHCFWS
jgi:hypothetical protein